MSKRLHSLAFCVGLAALLAPASATAAIPDTLTDADLRNAYDYKTYSNRLSCHDPSIVIDDITSKTTPVYYVYGSHLGHGKTWQGRNYQYWQDSWAAYEASGITNSLFADVNGKRINFSNAYSTPAVTRFKNCNGDSIDLTFDAHAWQSSGYSVAGNEWAPDVIYNKAMKKWCMYMSLNGDHWCSSIVLFTSNKVEGPWQYQGPVIMSGFQGSYAHNGYAAANDWHHSDLAIATGVTSLPQRYRVGGNWGSFWPNCIDPCVFYDDDDNLWMSYGSWSGGIFMIKLDTETGLRDYTYKFPYQVNGNTVAEGAANANCTSDPYFGKKIAGGHYVSGEGSYIKKIGDHWFLFLSYGGLNPSQGYQMRVFRADSPTGPYKDAYGTPAIYTSGRTNYGSNANDNRGVLLMDGYQWDTMPDGEVAQGHNSAFTDNRGRSFVVYHTKFNDGTFGHQVRVHQLFLNEDGWLMAAPYEFNGETVTNDAIASKASIADEDIPGTYQFIRHQYNQSHDAVSSDNQATTATLEEPVNINLTADGKVTGGETGTWKRTEGTDFITLTLAGVSYKGVLVSQQIDYTNIKAMCIAALSSSSGSLTIGKNSFTYQQEVWATKTPSKAAIKFTLDKTHAPFSDGATITETTSLPRKGYLGATVTWVSSNPSVMRSDGTVLGKGTVTLTMTVSKDSSVYARQYTLTVDKEGEATPAYYPQSTQKNTTAGWWSNFSTEDYTLTQGSTAEFKFRNYSNREANYKNWCLYGASTTHGATGYTEYFGIRCDNWDNTTASNTGCTSDFDWTTFTSDMDGSLVDMAVDYTTDGVFTMKAEITTKGGKTYNYSYTKAISSKPAAITLFFVSEGSYIDGSSLATGINSVRRGMQASDGKLYNLNGQQVDESYKGVVIRNGRKFVNE